MSIDRERSRDGHDREVLKHQHSFDRHGRVVPMYVPNLYSFSFFELAYMPLDFVFNATNKSSFSSQVG
jgi:hypothetical protein